MPRRCSCLERSGAPEGGSTTAQLDAEYSPSRIVPDFHSTLREYRRLSDIAKQSLPCELYIRYGDQPGELLHHFPARRPKSPLLVYVHGGHWQDLSIDDSCFAAGDLTGGGAGFTAVGYGLAPERSLDAMVASVAKAIDWVVENASSLGGTPHAIYAAGSSAGAHLLAMALGDAPAGASQGLAGVALLSGVYELGLLQHSYVNAALRLSHADAMRNSPIRCLPLRASKVIIARGQTETNEYARQHQLMACRLQRVGGTQPARAAVRAMVCEGRNHFDLPLGLGDPDEALGHAVLRMLQVAS